MSISRREFVYAACAACVVGCTKPQQQPTHLRISLGSLEQFSGPEVVRELERVFVRRDAQGWSALSLKCTHQGCLVLPESASGLRCPCHGALFSWAGEVLTGPPPRALPFLRLSIDAGELFLHPSEEVSRDWRLSPS